MTKRKPKLEQYWIHPGQWPVHIAYCRSESAYLAAHEEAAGGTPLPWLLDDNSSATTHRVTNRAGTLVILICIPQTKMFSEWLTTLTHEAQHALQYLQDEVADGWRTGDESDAYFVQYIVAQILAIERLGELEIENGVITNKPMEERSDGV